MTEPEVSVIIPVYNRAGSVAIALASALDQSFRDLEVVLVDDGSDDDLAAALAPFLADSRMRILHHEKRRGAAAARNTAIAAARGRWLAFLDSDDSWLPGKLEAQLAALAAAGPSVRMVLTSSLLDRGGGNVQLRQPTTEPSCRDAIMRGCTQCPGSAAMVARAAFTEYGPFDDRLMRLEDWDWLLRFTRHDSFIVIPQPFAVVNIHDYTNATEVDAACQVIWRRYRAEVRREGLRPWRTFASAVLIERAFPRLVLRRYASGLPLLLAAVLLDNRGTALGRRLVRRVSQRLGLKRVARRAR